MSDALRVAVAGNPNAGKTSVFNRLTGSRYQVGNYPGVTVEAREGTLLSRFGVGEVTLIDLPGTYSLTPISEDEAVAYRALTDPATAPDAVLLVLDATNLARNLYLAIQLFELNLPCVIALNMVDLARDAHLHVDADALGRALGVPVVSTDALHGEGFAQLASSLLALVDEAGRDMARADLLDVSGGPDADENGVLASSLGALIKVSSHAAHARWLLTAAAVGEDGLGSFSAAQSRVLAKLGPERVREATQALVIQRYHQVEQILAQLPDSSAQERAPAMARSAKIDRVLTHRVLGPLAFLAVMALVFQSIFTWSEPMMGWIEEAIGLLSTFAQDRLGPGIFTNLVTEGLINGVGNVLVFLPQIAVLFLFIGLLEDSGYMARAAFIVDRPMARLGLSGRAFVPLLSGFACAIPAIMGTRTLPRFRDRLVTMLMIPYMSCSARLPIYTLVIGALFEADRVVFGPFTVGGLILLALYLGSTLVALSLGLLYKRTLLRGPTPALVLELPPYRLPRLKNTLRNVYDRTKGFVSDAGTTILAVTVVLWGLLSFPRVDEAQLSPGETKIERSLGGRFGKAIEPVLEPIGQDWRMGVGLVGSFAAREVLVSTLGLVYGIEGVDDDDKPLRETIRNAVEPETGERRYTPLKGLALMVFFALAAQCMSTLAVVKRETRSWRWPLFMLFSMTAIAYLAALLVYQGGMLFGWR